MQPGATFVWNNDLAPAWPVSIVGRDFYDVTVLMQGYVLVVISKGEGPKEAFPDISFMPTNVIIDWYIMLMGDVLVWLRGCDLEEFAVRL